VLSGIQANSQASSQTSRLSERERPSTKDPKALRVRIGSGLFRRGQRTGFLPAASVSRAVQDTHHQRAWRRPSTKALEHAMAKDRLHKESHRHHRLHQKYQCGSGCRQDQGASPADAARLNALLNSGRRIGGQRFVYHCNVPTRSRRGLEIVDLSGMSS